ncbi:MAG: His/Gly/Thr/Pro-type tRNA ligase C-terminal domain-containing protein, partial [Planctomycetota bacterium]
RDLPIKINQWANVVRWEMRTRLFLRTAEFLWQEGHTVHATEQEAVDETYQMLDVYAQFAEEQMAVPVIKGEKTAGERFPGADMTVSIEAMMQDRKALQAGTSHFLGQNFAKAQDISFQDQDGNVSHAWTTSWGVSTRLIGALIMTHADDDGMVIPPRIAPAHAVILPIYRDDSQRAEVLEYCNKLKAELETQVYGGRVLEIEIDDRDLRGGEKKWYHVKRGVPVRIEVGPKDIAKDAVFMARRDTGEQSSVPRAELISEATNILGSIQDNLFQRALKMREENTTEITNEADFRAYFTPKDAKNPEVHGGFAHCYFSSEEEVQPLLNELKVTIRNIPLENNDEPGTCFLTGKPAEKKAVFAKAY